jgi:pimeloyl-ACP methyl ester carboxylesterase
MDLEPRFIDLRSQHFGDLTVHYREMGAGPPLLLIHGLMTTSYSWRYVLAPLATTFRVIAPDLVGCGRSDKPDVRYGPREVAAFIGALLDAFDMRGGNVVGNSMGGYLCMQLALDEPTAMSRLVNIHSPGVPMARLYALRAAMALPGAERLLHRMIGLSPLRWAHRNVHYWDEARKSLEEAHEYGDPLREAAGSRAFARYLGDTLSPFEMRRFVARLEREPFPIPLSLIYAKRDPMVPPWVGERLEALVPDAETQWLDECSHFAHVDRPEALSEAISTFFASG